MKQVEKDETSEQVFYLGRWVDKKHFRAFVYNREGIEKLAGSLEEFENLISSGIWLEIKPTNEIPVITESVNEKTQPQLGEVKNKYKVKEVKKPIELNQFKSNRTGGKQL